VGTSELGSGSGFVDAGPGNEPRKATLWPASLFCFQVTVSPARTVIFVGKKALMVTVSWPKPARTVRFLEACAVGLAKVADWGRIVPRRIARAKGTENRGRILYLPADP